MKKNDLSLFILSALLLLLFACGGKDPAAEPKPNPNPGGLNPNLPSQLALPGILSDNMVLQQNTPANIWGKAVAGSKITVTASWSTEEFSAITDAKGFWAVPVKTPAASKTAHTLTVTDSQKAVKKISNILVGEVWMCSGQSNMEMPMRGFGTVAGGNYQPVKDSEQELAAANYPEFRYFKVPYGDLTGGAAGPLFDTKASGWMVCTPANAREYSAIAFFFGRKIHTELSVPVGMIGCSYGGTRIEAWMPPGSLAGFSKDEYKDAAELGSPTHKSAPYILYNSMVAPVEKYTAKGLLWLQGESNFDNKASYANLLKEMVSGWRKARGDNSGSVPFYIVQIAPYGYSNPTDAAFLMEAQFRASKLIPNSGAVSAADVGDRSFQHYPDKKVPAERLAALALANQYGRTGIPSQGASYKNVRFENGKAYVAFDHAASLQCSSALIPSVQVAGADKVFHAATAAIVTGKAEIEVSSPQVPAPVAVRYCFTSWHVGMLYNEGGLPVFAFRTDDW